MDKGISERTSFSFLSSGGLRGFLLSTFITLCCPWLTHVGPTRL